MCDQLRFDYLSCYGHKTLHTPHIDHLAGRGVKFTNAYVQSPVCGPSRMSAYTGRYVRSHGSTQNSVPLRVGEPTLGEHLTDAGMRCALIGKTHMRPDIEGMKRLGIKPESMIGVRTAECGFEPFERDDGLHPCGQTSAEPQYNHYLRENGYDAESPWEYWANSAEGEAGQDLSGWLLCHADKPARIPEPLSESAYMTQRAMAFIDSAETHGVPWCAHLSYIKPHWPYIAPAPYHNMYGRNDIQPAIRSKAELENPHPLYYAYTRMRYSQNMSRDETREIVIPAYMGLIKQIDDQMGILFDYLEQKQLTQSTLIVFTSDHGDYLGDHWLGEKYLFHDVSAKVPLIICDPSAEADSTRGTTSNALVEMIDLAPTFLEYADGEPKPHILEGLSLTPLLHKRDNLWPRKVAFSELDYSDEPLRLQLGRNPRDCQSTMAFDGRYKLIEAQGFRHMLFDLEADPDELNDLGNDSEYEPHRIRLIDAINDWYRGARNRITVPDSSYTDVDNIIEIADINLLAGGVKIGYWDESELKLEQEKVKALLKSKSVGEDR
ncbi:phosphonate monoester hydrolase [Chromatiales bacterium (ex Bugula neritina AB1)]|nr:phosphonate monoester hydrolase [Chromatiales bacterium (ex Bugula neritina AB1)]